MANLGCPIPAKNFNAISEPAKQSKKLNPKLRTEDAKNTRGKMDISPEDKAEEERGSEV